MYTVLRALPLALLVATPAAELCAQPAVDPSLVAVVTAADGEPLQNAVVLIGLDGPGRFTDAAGIARFHTLRETTARINVGKAGFRLAELDVRIRTGSSDTVRVRLDAWRPRFAAASVTSGPRCGVLPANTRRDSTAHAIIEQGLINARQYRLLARDYPYVWANRREILAGTRSRTADDALTLIGVDTILIGSGTRDWRYRSGNVGSAMEDDSIGTPALTSGITLADLADSAFMADHCFRYRGVEGAARARLARIDFAAIRQGEAKGSGSIFLDSATLRVRRMEFQGSRSFLSQTGSDRFESFEVTTTFSERVAGVPIPDRVVTMRHAEGRAVPGARRYNHAVKRERRQLIAIVAIPVSAIDPSPLRPLLPAVESVRPSYAAELEEMVGDSIRRAAFGFVRRWRGAWQMTEAARHPVRDTTAGISRTTWKPLEKTRVRLLHCHIENADTAIFAFRSRAIQSGAGKRAICPSWALDSTATEDEGEWIDAGIDAQRRPAIRAARDSLLDALTAEALRRPDDPWPIGQLVRFAIDQRDDLRADYALSLCQAERWWCFALEGYVQYTRGAWAPSDSAFAEALTTMPDSTRCRWTDVGPLLYANERLTYGAIPCASRDSINERFWWLSDPLWIEPGNERRSAHYARLVLARLRSEGVFPERWEAAPRYGGNSVTEMIVRYGWPTMAWWGGSGEDFSHYSYLGVTAPRRQLHGAFGTAEYSTDRPHVVPRLSAIENPLQAKPGDWFLSAPKASLTGEPEATWWPMEHFRRRGGMLTQLWEQHAMFRRQNGVLLAVSTHPMPEAVGATAGDMLSARLLIAHRADSIDTMAGRFAAGSPSVIQAAIPSHPFLLGLEVFGPQGLEGPASRTRFAINPPEPLASLPAGEVAISDPAFLVPPEPGGSMPLDPRLALNRLFPNTTFTTGGRIGLYWESYGVRPGDQAAMSVVAVRGKDTTVVAPSRVPSRAVPAPDGDVSIQAHGMVVDLSAFEPGTYSLEVRMAVRGKTAVGRRSLWIVRGNERVEPVVAEATPFGPSEDQWVNSLIAVGRMAKPKGSPIYLAGYDELNLMIADSVGMFLPKSPDQIAADKVSARVWLLVMNPTTESLTVMAVIQWPGQPTSEASCWTVRRVNGKWTPSLVRRTNAILSRDSNTNPRGDCRTLSER